MHVNSQRKVLTAKERILFIPYTYIYIIALKIPYWAFLKEQVYVYNKSERQIHSFYRGNRLPSIQQLPPHRVRTLSEMKCQNDKGEEGGKSGDRNDNGAVTIAQKASWLTPRSLNGLVCGYVGELGLYILYQSD